MDSVKVIPAKCRSVFFSADSFELELNCAVFHFCKFYRSFVELCRVLDLANLNFASATVTLL